MSDEHPTVREFAALAYALAATRGLLSGVLMDKYDHEEVARVLAGTSTKNIAAAIGSKAADLAVDWSEYLSETEQRAIKGAAQP
jgi:hypothetical protein